MSSEDFHGARMERDRRGKGSHMTGNIFYLYGRYWGLSCTQFSEFTVALEAVTKSYWRADLSSEVQ